MSCDNIWAGDSESLDKHIRTALNEFNTLFVRTKYTSVLSRIFGYNEENLENACKICILFHDIAKAYDQYQERIRRRGEFTYPAHDYYSAYIVNKLIENKWKGEIITAISWHHGATRGFRVNIEETETGRILDEIVRELQEITLNESSYTYVLNMLENIIKDYYIKEVKINELPNKITFKELKSFFRNFEVELLQKKKNEPKFFRRTHLLTRILLFCDNLAASKNRGNKDKSSRIPIFISDFVNPEEIEKAFKEIQMLLEK